MIKFQDRGVTVFESALFRTTSTVLKTNDLILVVDPNWLPNEVAEIQNYVSENRGDLPLFLLFTHSDYDHIIGYNAFPEAQIIVSKAFQNNPKKQDSLDGIINFDDEYYISRDYEIQYPKGDIIIEKDGQQLKIGKTILTFYLSPGHNTDGIFTIVEPLNVWISGDYLSNEEFPYIYFSSIAYEETLAKVDAIFERHNIEMLIPGHGDIAFDEKDIKNRRDENLDYVSGLRDAITKGEEYDIEKLWKKYRFPKIMTRFHEGNVELIKKEIEGKR